MALFQVSVLNTYLKSQEEQKLANAFKKFSKYFHNPAIQENIRNSKEEQFQATFLNELFVNVLGYTLNPQPDFNLSTEFKNENNARKADGAILQDGAAIGVIELKGTNTKDLEGIRRQAFDYKVNQKSCVYVITSNFEKLRFYINDATEFIEFDLFLLTAKDFTLLYLCLQKENILKNLPLKIKESSVVKEEQITKDFYKDYSVFKRELYRDLVRLNAKTLKNIRLSDPDFSGVEESNPDYEKSQAQLLRLEKNVKLELFKKSQKLIDRFLFIFFAEDRGLLPPNSTIRIVKDWNKLKELDAVVPLYNRFKLYFSYLDQGRKSTDTRAEIFAYNGGLFKPDNLLDRLEINDELLAKHTTQLSKYNFESQVDVNILGHIFENSLNEIESVSAEIEGDDFDKQKSKRKKDGVFYTPKYITKYIVENTLGKLCEEKKSELGFREDEYYKGRKRRQKDTLESLIKILDDYRDWLLKLTICDPACGSGAFLNQALDFLIKEHRYIDELKSKLLGGGLVFSDIETTILEKNIYGVDINEESVEIAKLSLWLRTAQPRRKLNDLNSNIKCGNSLIDDEKVAGDKAFKWEEEFKDVFTKGGFDVVIGNPPYVRADSPGNDLKFRAHLTTGNQYKTLAGKWDLYIPFIELSHIISSKIGTISLIVPDAYCHAEYSTKSLEYFTGNISLSGIDYFPGISIFENVGVHSVIVNFQKGRKTFNYIKREHDIFKVYHELSLKEYPTSFRNDFKMSILKTKHKLVPIEDVFYITKGIVGNSDEKKFKGEFKVGDLIYEIKDDVHSRLYYEGKNISKWFLSDTRFIEYNTERSPSKWSRKGFSEFFESRKIVTMRSPGVEPRSFIDEFSGFFNESAIGFVLWKDLNGIQNKSISQQYDDDEDRERKEKISSNFKLFYALGIFNSKLIKFELNADRRSNIHIYPDDWRKIKLPISTLDQMTQFEQICKSIVERQNSLNQKIQRFQNFLSSKFYLRDLNRKLQSWHNLEFGEFLKELNKAIKTTNKVRTKEGHSPIPELTKKDEFEWMELFEENKKKSVELQLEIENTDKEIDLMVYKLYDLTYEEVLIVDEGIGMREEEYKNYEVEKNINEVKI
jgi:type I restriction-modification system DNA methylase subunit